MRARRAAGAPGEFDIVIAMTHDHGLIPVKYLGVEQGVNVTLACPSCAPAPTTAPPSTSPAAGARTRPARRRNPRMARQLVAGVSQSALPERSSCRRARGGALDQVGVLEGAHAPGSHSARACACVIEMVSWRFAAREDEEAAPRADVVEAHLLPLVLQVHLVGEAEPTWSISCGPREGSGGWLGELGG